MENQITKVQITDKKDFAPEVLLAMHSSAALLPQFSAAQKNAFFAVQPIVISSTFVDSLQVPNEKIENIGKVAFIWITKGDNLVMQSKNKFADYFYPNLRNTLSTFESCSDTLKENEVLFINWEKITQSKEKDRLNRRRPEDELHPNYFFVLMFKYYF